MKHLFTITLFLLAHVFTMAQGTITSMEVQPANPTTSDDIVVLVDIQFPNSSCDAEFADHSVVGSTITASAHHCSGMLTAICNTTDTFQIGQLSAGNYSFNITLSSGFGGPGCSPGIVPDDAGQVQFNVSQAVGIMDSDRPRLTLHPNPSKDLLYVGNPQSLFNIVSIDGKQVMQGVVPTNGVLPISSIGPGIYSLELQTEAGMKRALFIHQP